jgi:thioesterase domain-containing protein
VTSLREALREHLPEYMIPSNFVTLEEFPRTPNGKVDRKALPAPDTARPKLEKDYVEPRTETEKLLAGIWSQLLGVDRVGIHDDFFDLGGHSMLAVRLFARIEAVTERKLPLTVLFQRPTVAQLAELIHLESAPVDWSSLVPIRTHGSKPPLFCVHPAGGYTLYYRDLAARLDPDQPIYSLQSKGLDGQEYPFSCLEEIVADYVKEIRNVQPHGPYYLAGLCFGGVAAFEMAQQIRDQGEEVALVALLDTYTPDYERQLGSSLSLKTIFHRVRERVDLEFSNLAELRRRERPAYVLEKMRRVCFYTYLWIRSIYHRIRHPRTRELKHVEAANLRAMQSYEPQVYPGRVTLFRAAKQPAGNGYDPTLGWRGLASGGLDIQEVAGYHSTIAVEPQVKDLAAKLTASLNRAHVASAEQQRVHNLV